MKKWYLAAGVSVSLAACDMPAGHHVDSGEFGNATLNNTQIHNGELSYATVLANRFVQEVPNTINFAFDSAKLDATAQQVLLKQADWIKKFPEVRFRVYGHTDAVGSDAYNRRLGQRRANAVVSFFASQGINRNRLEALVSYGESQLAVATPDRDRRNRRTVTEVAGFAKRHPTVLDGKYAEIIYREYVESATQKGVVESQQSTDGFGSSQ